VFEKQELPFFVTMAYISFKITQMLGLEKRFEKQQYLSTPDRVELAELLGLSQLQVKTWYQNRRMKWKKQVRYFVE